ncbi:phosphotransferase [Flavobacteriaceae bacterium Ap0902]|nr:phosphotransferase [Flavobacteriaceae bacterium Ap0902]
MMDLFNFIAEKNNFKINHSQSLSGGDISDVYLLNTSHGDYVIKINDSDKINIFLSEQTGLLALKNSNTLRIPEVYNVGQFTSYSYIIMEYIPSGDPKNDTFKNFGEKLAKLHMHTSDAFGFKSNNLIGTLPQLNNEHATWSEFYWEERIKPQFQLAVQKGLMSLENIPSKEKFKQAIDQEFCDAKPSLIHGDLWNGNYLVDDKGDVALIDPAVYYGHPMMDIGMSQLFGGFPNAFLEAYKDSSNCAKSWQSQIELAQLYYLLVHLNLFGTSYLSPVLRIKEKFLDA